MKTVAKSFDELKSAIKEETTKNNGEHMPKVTVDWKGRNITSYEDYKALDDYNKKYFLKVKGLNFSLHSLRINKETKTVVAPIANPFTGEKMYATVDFSKTLKEHPALSEKFLFENRNGKLYVSGKFAVNTNPKDANDIIIFIHSFNKGIKQPVNKKKDNEERFGKFLKLPYDEKKRYLTKKGVNLSLINFKYNPSTSSLSTNIKNPFTGKKIRFRYDNDDLGRHEITIKGILVINHNIINENQIFSYVLYPKANGNNSSLMAPNKDNYESNKEEKLIIDTLQEHEKIYFDDFVALHDASNCSNNNHNLEKINALINVLCKNGNIKHMRIAAWYCHNCKRYFLKKWQYDNLWELGIPLCQIIKDDNHFSHTHSGNYYDELATESILYRSGYNVSMTENLTEEQRRKILVLMLESGICDLQKIDSHLTWLIESRRNNEKMTNAVKKWEEDREYISRYKFDYARQIGIKLIRNIR